MNSFKRKVLVSFMAMALCLTTVFGTSTTTEAASSKKAVKSVTLKVGSKKVNSKTIKLTQGKYTTVKVTVNPSSAKKSITYKSSNKKSASIYSKGKIKGVKAGKAPITVTVKGKNNKTKKASFKVIVQKKPTPTKKPTKAPTKTEVAVTGVKLSSTKDVVEVGGECKVTAVIIPSNATDKTVTYTSSNPSIASVDAKTGVVKAHKNGKVTITATTNNMKEASVVIEVKTVEITSLYFENEEVEVSLGQNFTNPLKTVPANATNQKFTWDSTDKSVATVSDSGVISILKVGTTTISAKSENGLVATYVLNVIDSTSTNINGIDIKVTNEIDSKKYPNTVFTGKDANIRIKLSKDELQTSGRVKVELKNKAGAKNDRWFITDANDNQSTSYLTKADENGVVEVSVGLKQEYSTLTAIDDAMGAYEIVATAMGSGKSQSTILRFAKFTVGSEDGGNDEDDVDGYSFSNINVLNDTNLEQGDNASGANSETNKIPEVQKTNHNIQEKDSQANAYNRTEYVVSQMCSRGTDNNEVVFNTTPYIQYLNVSTDKDNEDYDAGISKQERIMDDVYQDTEAVYVHNVPTNLSYATVSFDRVVLSLNAALRIELYEEVNGKIVNEDKPLKSYALLGAYDSEEMNNGGLAYQVPMTDLKDYARVCVKIYMRSEGQITTMKQLGFTVSSLTGVYLDQETYDSKCERYEGAYIDWTQVRKSEVASDNDYTTRKESTVNTITKDQAEKYGISNNKDGLDRYAGATFTYVMPVYPHVGNAIFTVKRANNAGIDYWMMPTYATDNNTNVLLGGKKAFLVSEDEVRMADGSDLIGNYEVDKEYRTITLNSNCQGITEVYGVLRFIDEAHRVPGLQLANKDDNEKNRLFACVQWAENTKVQDDVRDYYAFAGQTVSINIQVTGASGSGLRDQEVVLKMNDDETELTKELLQKDNIYLVNDDAKDGIIRTDSTGKAVVQVRCDDYSKMIKKLSVTAKNKSLTAKAVIGDNAGNADYTLTEGQYANIHWISPGLKFTDSATVKPSEIPDKKYNTGLISRDYTGKTTCVYADEKGTKNTEEQKKLVNSKWHMGYQVVGKTTDEACDTSNTEIEILNMGVKTELTGNESSAAASVGTEISKDVKKGTIDIESQKTGNDVIRGKLDSSEIEKASFKITDATGINRITKNVGTGAVNFDTIGLNIPIRWTVENAEIKVESPSGTTFVIGNVKTFSVYLKAEDASGNRGELQDKIKYWVSNGGTAVAGSKEEPLEVSGKNGIAAVKFGTKTIPFPLQKCTYSLNYLDVSGVEKSFPINFVEKTTQKPFAMLSAKQGDVLADSSVNIDIECSDYVNESTVVKDMFEVRDSNGTSWNIKNVTVDGSVIKLNVDVANAAVAWVNITYKSVEEDLEGQNTEVYAQSMSGKSDNMIMEDGFTVSAYRTATPKITYQNGEVTSKDLLVGTYVVFVYGDNSTNIKKIEYKPVTKKDENNNSAVCDGAKSAKYVEVHYAGTSKTFTEAK